MFFFIVAVSALLVACSTPPSRPLYTLVATDSPDHAAVVTAEEAFAELRDAAEGDNYGLQFLDYSLARLDESVFAALYEQMTNGKRRLRNRVDLTLPDGSNCSLSRLDRISQYRSGVRVAVAECDQEDGVYSIVDFSVRELSDNPGLKLRACSTETPFLQAFWFDNSDYFLLARAQPRNPPFYVILC